MSWVGFTPLEAVCPDCGEQCEPWGRPAPLDWRDEAEEHRGRCALAIQAHRREHHPSDPEVGALVTYSMPWRGHVLESEVYRVTAIRPDDHLAFARSMGADVGEMLGHVYALVNPHRSSDQAGVLVGDPDRPITFRTVADAPPVQTTLLDLLDWEDAA